MAAVGWSPVSGVLGPGLTGSSAGSGPKAHQDVRVANTALLLRAVQATGGCSRTELTRLTGLSKATVSTLVAELLAQGLVTDEGPDARGGVGRPSTTLRVAPGRVAGLGLELSSSTLTLSVVDLSGATHTQRAVAVPGPDHSPATLLDLAGSLLAEEVTALARAGTAVPRAVIAQPGVIDYVHGAVRTSTPLGWHDVPILQALGEAVAARLPDDVDAPELVVENDAKLAALAAYGPFSRQGVRNLLYLSGGQGVGGGIIADGHLLRGWLGYTGEVGHMPVEPDGRLCRCGRRGCWETLVGLGAFADLYPAADPLNDEALSVDERSAVLRRRLEAGDPALSRRLEQVTRDLERGLATLVDVLSPEVIVLSGWLGALADRLVAPVAQALAERRLSEEARVLVVPSPLGEWAPSLGAAQVALELVLEDPTRLTPRV